MIRNFSKKAAIIILTGTLYTGGALFGLPPKVTLAVVNTAQAPVITAPVESNAFTQWLNRLEEAESNDSGNAHLKILDHNHKYSYGCLQFQAATFLAYGKRYDLIPDDLTSVEPLIYNCILQKRLATDMIEGNYRNWRQWYHSVKDEIGLPPQPEVAVAENQ